MRFYEAKLVDRSIVYKPLTLYTRFPEVDELVMVSVKQIQEMGAYVKLVSMVIDNLAPPPHPLRSTAGVRQYRGHDFALRALQKTYSVDSEANQGGKE